MSDDGLYYTGPDGEMIKLDQLPRRGLKRWRPRDKAMVITAVRHGLISVDEACARYDLSIDEYLCWYRCYAPQPSEDRP
jgi:hypothetical protein